MSYTQNVKVARDEREWSVTLAAEISAEGVAQYYQKALKEVQKTAKIDGFRQGHAPLERIEQIYGEDVILRRAAEMAIQDELPEILAQEKLIIIEAPRVHIPAPDRGKPLSFTATAPLLPKIQLPDYKSIAEKYREITEDLTVSDKEYDDALVHIRRERARIEKMEVGSESQKAYEEAHALPEQDLPAIDDAFVQSLGYTDAEEFSKKLRENLGHEKQRRAEEKRRGVILDELVKNSKVSHPSIMCEYELDDMEAQMRYDLSRMGATFEQYLADSKKTQVQLREEWRGSAEKRVKIRLILSDISRAEQIEATDEVIDHELTHALEHNPKADRTSLRSHIVHTLRNELTLRFLEGNPEPVGHSVHEHKH